MDTHDSLSSVLHEARVTKGLELSDISEITHVRKEYLKALEEGRYADLPEDIYARNFLRLYAQAVGLDDSKLLDRYSRERRAALGITQEVSSSSGTYQDTPSQETSGRPGGWIITVLLLAALAGLGYFGFSRNLFTTTFPFIRLPSDNTSVTTEPTVPRPGLPANDTLSSSTDEIVSDPEAISDLPSSAPELTNESANQASTESEVAAESALATEPANDAPASADEPVVPDGLANETGEDTTLSDTSTTEPTSDTAQSTTNLSVVEGSEVGFTLITDPPGADASIDNYPFASRTPVFNAPVTARAARVLRVELEGYETYQELIDITDDTSLSISLKPLGASEATVLNPDSPASPLANQPNTQGKLAIRIEAETWLEVYQSTTRGEGEQLVYSTVQPGETFSFNLPVYVHVGNAAGIRLNENGQDIGLLGSSGEVTGRSFGEVLPVSAAPATESPATESPATESPATESNPEGTPPESPQ